MLLPDHETAVDFLNYEAISKTVVGLLRENRKHALTIGIHGDWGAGKSSVLKMIETEIGKDKTVACLWFNGWTFQGFDDAKTVLIENTISELRRQRSAFGKVEEMAVRLLKRIDLLKVLKHGAGLAFTVLTGMPSPDQIQAAGGILSALVNGVAGMAPDEIRAKITEAGDILKSAEAKHVPHEIHEFRKEFRELLDEAKVDQLVVLIDDLDRCLPATAIDTLEAIRLFLFVPKTAFIIGADEAMIEYAVREHFPNLPLSSGPLPYARNYLEKLIQVPVRIPALGIPETKTYVTLLLVEHLVGEGHAGFRTLLGKARESLNRPWLPGGGVSQADVTAVDGQRRADLEATSVLAQQIGPILAEGTKGNPRQIKRFLNALLIRQAIAKARQFAVNQAVLAKLMLAERFQPDFYEHITTQAMLSSDGTVAEIVALESAAQTDGKKAELADATRPSESDPTMDKWLEREWLQRWAKIKPALGGEDVRPYVFVARDKRLLAGAAEHGGFERLIEKLSGGDIAMRSAEPDVRALPPADAELVFNALRDQVLRQGSFTTPPPGFSGLRIVAKHHTRFQADLLGLVRGIEPGQLGVWVVKGWNEVLTDTGAKAQFQELLNVWATQEANPMLKRAAAGAALGTTRSRG